jgi:hypothetical protein
MLYYLVLLKGGYMKNILNSLENISILAGISISLPQIETVLGIVILSIQLVLIIAKFTIKIIDKVKNKDYNGIVKDVEDTQDEINKITNKKGE